MGGPGKKKYIRLCPGYLIWSLKDWSETLLFVFLEKLAKYPSKVNPHSIISLLGRNNTC